jgi:alginate O-acetyltransferase complex protein AlgJ
MEMKKFVLKSVLFLIPFLAAIGIELFVLPIDFFTFRVWEALVIRKFRNILPGEFYPNMEITKIEEGDLAHHTKFTYKRKVKWYTDQYGYRKQNTNRGKNEVVIIGDSNIAGSGLTQEDILSEVLEKKLRVSVYPISPASLETFLKERRFLSNPPDIVIISSVERFIFYLPPVKVRSKKISTKLKAQIREIGYRLRNQISGNRFIQCVGVYLDRIYKANMLQYLRASLRRIGSSHSETIFSRSVSSKYGPVFFLQGADANKDVPKDQFDKAVQVIKTYDELLRSKGIRFIFLPIPEKENIYYKSLHIKRPVFLEQLISALKHLGIETVDTQKAFEKAFQKGVLLYHTNDTHWNENAVRITADLINELIESKK